MSQSDFDKIAVVVPVREGSTRVKDKVTLPMTDQLNLIEWKLSQLKQIINPANVFLSSDSENLLSLGRARGVSLHRRDPFLCRGHEATFSEVITGIVQEIPYEHIAWVTVVVPLMSPEEYQAGFRQYLENVVDNQNNDSLVAVNHVKEYFWDKNRSLNYQADRNHTISQELPDWYRVTNGLYMMPRESILKVGYFLGPNPRLFTVSKLAGIDIDEWEDYQIALALRPLYEQNLLDAKGNS